MSARIMYKVLIFCDWILVLFLIHHKLFCTVCERESNGQSNKFQFRAYLSLVFFICTVNLYFRFHFMSYMVKMESLKSYFSQPSEYSR